VKTAAVAFAASTIAGAALTPAVRGLAQRWKLFDHGLSSRKIHGKPIPRLGGVAIVFAFYAPLVALFFVDSDVGRRFWAQPEKALGLIAGGLAIAVLGICDDLRGCGAKQKFVVQFAVAALMYAVGFRIDVIANPFGSPLPLGALGFPFTMLWIAGVVNAMNLIDGLDGLAGGVAFIAIASTFVVSLVHGEPLMMLFTAALAGSVLGFLFYNFNPASIFMGDTGSMFLGFVLATTSLQTQQKSSTAVALVVPILALGVPIADTLLAMFRRAARGAPMFSADRGHIHHRLLAAGLSHRSAVLVLYGASFVLGGSALVLSFASQANGAWVLLVVCLASFVALRRLGFFSVAQVKKVIEDRRKNLDVRREIRRIGDALRQARHFEDLWVALRIAARALDAAAFALHLPADAASDLEAHSEGFDEAGLDLFRARFGLVPERHGDTHLELGWSDGRTAVDRDTEIAIELLCDHLSAAIERIERAAPAPQAEGEGDDEPGKVANLRR
jgi:UDP-GlcNAc:undecaprenyl-phosphate GlcNAc-1-phosphate transferase